MRTTYKVLIGFANGDLHFNQVMEAQDPLAMGLSETDQIGKLTNAGFCSIVSVVGLREEGATAVIEYAAVWNGERIDVLVKPGSRMASSYELYALCLHNDNLELDASRLRNLCLELRLDRETELE